MTSQTKLILAIALVAVTVSVGCNLATTSAAASKDSSSNSGSSSIWSSITGNSSVDVVKNGFLVLKAEVGGAEKRYDSTTVGKAFEGTFQNPQWKTLETAKGATVVEFDGTVKVGSLSEYRYFNVNWPDLIPGCVESLGLPDKNADRWKLNIPPAVENCVKALQLPVKFQFMISADKKDFTVSYIDQPIFAGHELDALAFIYQ